MSILNDSVTLLVLHTGETDECRTLVESALYGCSVLQQIDWNGAAPAL